MTVCAVLVLPPMVDPSDTRVARKIQLYTPMDCLLLEWQIQRFCGTFLW